MPSRIPYGHVAPSTKRVVLPGGKFATTRFPNTDPSFSSANKYGHDRSQPVPSLGWLEESAKPKWLAHLDAISKANTKPTSMFLVVAGAVLLAAILFTSDSGGVPDE